MFRTAAFLALCCCTCLISCQQQMQAVAYALETTHSVAEDTPVALCVGYVRFRLQLLPHHGGVRVTSSHHPVSPPHIKKENPAGTFVLKDNAYGVESQLRAIIAQGYKQRDTKIQGDEPCLFYYINGGSIRRSFRSFSAGDDRPSRTDNPLYDLNRVCTEAAAHELPAPKQR